MINLRELEMVNTTAYWVKSLNMNLPFRGIAFTIFLLLPTTYAIAQLTDKEIYDAKGGHRLEDRSYIYRLPYENAKRYFLIQAANSKMSHQDELSLDFKMKKGSKICAARDGVVLATKSDSNIGGLDEKYLGAGNHIIILHSDSSVAKYWHLAFHEVYVKAGDAIAQGQCIGLSGNTGYSAFPHLHFQVVDKQGRQILTRFETSRGVIYLRPGKWYKTRHTAN